MIKNFFEAVLQKATKRTKQRTKTLFSLLTSVQRLRRMGIVLRTSRSSLIRNPRYPWLALLPAHRGDEKRFIGLVADARHWGSQALSERASGLLCWQHQQEGPP